MRERVEVRRATDSSGSFDAIYVTMTPRSESEGGGVELINHLTGQTSRHRSRRSRGRRARGSGRLRSRSSENDLPPAYPGHVARDAASDGDEEDDNAAAKEGEERGPGDASPPPSYEQCFPRGREDVEAAVVVQAHPSPGTRLNSNQTSNDTRATNGAATNNISPEHSSSSDLL